ncbi:hypothetical protein BJX70DRAFT_181693 [Aspergillus crustosus]
MTLKICLTPFSRPFSYGLFFWSHACSVACQCSTLASLDCCPSYSTKQPTPRTAPKSIYPISLSAFSSLSLSFSSLFSSCPAFLGSSPYILYRSHERNIMHVIFFFLLRTLLPYAPGCLVSFFLVSISHILSFLQHHISACMCPVLFYFLLGRGSINVLCFVWEFWLRLFIIYLLLLDRLARFTGINHSCSISPSFLQAVEISVCVCSLLSYTVPH